MLIQEYINNSNQTLYRISKDSEIPYNTLKDLYTGKTKVQKASSETIYKLAKYFHVSMEEMMEPYIHDRCDFSLFKSDVCHQLKNMGDKAFLADVLRKGAIPLFFDRSWYPEAFYVLAMVDYLSRIHKIPIVKDYNKYRCRKLEKPIYPLDAVMKDKAAGTDKYKKEAYLKAIPEFKKYNLMEPEVRDVV